MGLIVELERAEAEIFAGIARVLSRFLGGFTTFSAFSLDSALLIERGDWVSAALYILGSVVFPLARCSPASGLCGSAALGMSADRRNREATKAACAWTAGSSATIRHCARPSEKMLRTGQVRVDGKRAKSGDRLEARPNDSSAAPDKATPPPARSSAAAAERSRPEFITSLVLHEDASVFVSEQAARHAKPGRLRGRAPHRRLAVAFRATSASVPPCAPARPRHVRRDCCRAHAAGRAPRFRNPCGVATRRKSIGR